MVRKCRENRLYGGTLYCLAKILCRGPLYPRVKEGDQTLINLYTAVPLFTHSLDTGGSLFLLFLLLRNVREEGVGYVEKDLKGNRESLKGGMRKYENKWILRRVR